MSNVLRRAAVVGAMTGISRIAGLVREQLMAYFFGTGLAKSVFDVAFRIPNLFRRLFGEGALSAAFIPVFTEVRAREGPVAANRLAARVAGLLLATLSLITALIMLLTLAVEPLLPPDSRWAAILPLLRIMLPYAPLICLAALAMGILNALKHFAVPALAPVFLNLAWILTLIGICPWLPPDPFIRIRAVAWAVIAAGVIQLAVQFPVLGRLGIPLRLSFHWRQDARIRQIMLLMAPMILGAGLVQINVMIDGFLALWAAPWAPSALEYAERLVYLPLGLIGNAFATVLLPTLAAQATSRDFGELSTTLERAIRNIWIIMAPAAIGLTLLAYPVVTLVYRIGDGAFQAESALHTARALAGYAPGLLFFSLYKALTAAFYALQDTRTPVRVGIFCVAFNLLLNVLSILVLPPGWKHMGIAVSTVAASLANCIALIVILRRRTGALHVANLRSCAFGASLAALLMGGVVVRLHPVVLVWMAVHLPLKLAEIGTMLGVMAAGAALYGLLVRLLCRPALKELTDDFRNRKSRRGR